MYSVKLEWKQFNVDLDAIHAWVKNLAGSTYKGASADTALTLWFDTDVNAIPTEPQTVQEEQTHQEEVQVPTLDNEGNPMLDIEGNPMTHAEMQDVTEMVDVVIQVPTGEPSKAQQIKEYWESIESDSAEATAYAQKAQMAAVKKQVENIAAFSQDLLNQFAAENIAMGITADNKTEEVLDVMLPVMSALQGGAPTIAIKRAKAISEASYDAKYVTAARLLAYVNKIEAFLGLPQSNSL